jgi:succinate dehydrogenase/fumarate reductase flavoprotein subunit
MLQQLPDTEAPTSADVAVPPDLSGFSESKLENLRSRLKQLMWDHLGIVRTASEMSFGAQRLHEFRHEWSEMRETTNATGDGQRWVQAAEALNMIDVAGLIVRCALWRRESRGLHYLVELPYKDNEVYLRDSFVVPTE